MQATVGKNLQEKNKKSTGKKSRIFSKDNAVKHPTSLEACNYDNKGAVMQMTDSVLFRVICWL